MRQFAGNLKAYLLGNKVKKRKKKYFKMLSPENLLQHSNIAKY